MRPSRTRWLLAAAAVVALGGAAQAQSATERTKKKIARLFEDAVAAVNDSVVRIKAGEKDIALGTIVSTTGYVLTKGSELPRGGFAVHTKDGAIYDNPQYVGYHKPTDLALLKIDAVTDLKAVAFADGKEAVVGNWVAAPAGPAATPAAVGVVSTPVRKLIDRSEAVIRNGNKGYLGINPGDPTDDGLAIFRVSPGGAADRAKLKAGDVILEISGRAIKDPETLFSVLDTTRPGQTLTVKVKRGEEEIETKVKLQEARDTDRSEFQNSMGSKLSSRRTGFPAVIQHDAVLAPADCGGPLVDLDGKVLGVNIARAGRVESWTLPAEVIRPVLMDLKQGKYPPPKDE